jgi:hypothetical protein
MLFGLSRSVEVDSAARRPNRFLTNCWYVAAWDHELIDAERGQSQPAAA